jgi:hypothetical protein
MSFISNIAGLPLRDSINDHHAPACQAPMGLQGVAEHSELNYGEEFGTLLTA